MNRKMWKRRDEVGRQWYQPLVAVAMENFAWVENVNVNVKDD